jgi:hypothetical protein
MLPRLLSVSGFGLVLVLFFLLPFLSVSCEVQSVNGSARLDYTGTHLVTGDRPELVTTGQLRPPDDESGSRSEEDLVPGVRGLATVLVALAAAGVVMGLVPRAVARFGSAALAGATLVVAVVTLVVAQANLKSVLLTELQEVVESSAPAGSARPDLESGVDKALEVGIGFWLVVAVLVAVLLLNAGAAVLSRRAREPSPTLEP